MSGQGFKTMGRWVRQHQDGAQYSFIGQRYLLLLEILLGFFRHFYYLGPFSFFIKR